MALSPRFRRRCRGTATSGWARGPTPRGSMSACTRRRSRRSTRWSTQLGADLGMRRGNALLVRPASARRCRSGSPPADRGGRRRCTGRTRPRATARHERRGRPRSPVGSLGRCRRRLPLLRARRRPDRAAAVVGGVPHLHRDDAGHRPDDLQPLMFPQLRAALDRDRGPAGLAGAIHPERRRGLLRAALQIAGTTLLSKSARSGWPSTSTSRRNQRGTVGPDRIRRAAVIFQQWGFMWGGT